MDIDFVIEGVSPYLEGSYLFFGILSKTIHKYTKVKETLLENIILSRECLEESIQSDYSVWYKIVGHLAGRERGNEFDENTIGSLYDMYYRYEESIIDDNEHMGDILFHLGESDSITWIKKWFLLDKNNGIISSEEWFMGLLGTITRGYLKNIQWFFSTGVPWKLEEIKTSYSMAFHAVNYTDCFKFISGERCCKDDVGVIESFVEFGLYDMVDWAIESGYT